MTKFTKIQKQYCWPEVESVLKDRIGEEKTAECFAEAIRLSKQYEEKYNGLKGFEKKHASAAYNIAVLYIPIIMMATKSQSVCRRNLVSNINGLQKMNPCRCWVKPERAMSI